MARLLGIDVGTSSCKVILVDETGRVLKRAVREYPLSTPRPLWSEQDPEDWWRGVSECLEEIGGGADAIGLTGQMHGAVFLGEHDEVIRPAILWNDQRTAAECAEIDARVGAERVQAITCNPPLTGFQLPKILWLRNHEPENFARLRSVLLPKDYVRLRLTGVKATEVSDASGTGAFDVPKRRWSAEVLSAVNLPLSLFPPCEESSVVTSRTREGIPVVGGGGDQAAGAVGTGAVQSGVISLSLGTSGVVFTAIPNPDSDPTGAAHTFCHANGAWHAMGVTLSCGGSLRWARDVLFPGDSYDALAEEAGEAPLGCEGLSFLPYLAGERCPHNDPSARGVWAGLTLAHHRGHLARSVFEGVSFSLADALDRLRQLGATAEEIRLTGGGSRSPFLRQMLADVLDAPCVAVEVDEGPALGAALLAGVGVGVWSSVEIACAQTVRMGARTEPTGANYQAALLRYRRLYEATKAWSAALVLER